MPTFRTGSSKVSAELTGNEGYTLPPLKASQAGLVNPAAPTEGISTKPVYDATVELDRQQNGDSSLPRSRKKFKKGKKVSARY